MTNYIDGYKEMVNSAAKWGLILGVLMSASRIFETRVLVSGDVSEFMFLTLEWVAASVIYVLILHRANKQRAASRPAEQGYAFRDILNYTILISIFASFIVAVSSHIYIVNSIGGYVNFAEATTESLNAVIAEAGVDVESNAALLEQSAKSTESIIDNPPTILTAVLSAMSSYILAGLLTTVALYWFVRRKKEYVGQCFTDANEGQGDEQK
ncbi:MAG: DUF4199 domain-containing protein [Rikenellaceae bacterium]